MLHRFAFLLPPERAHRAAIRALPYLPSAPPAPASLSTTLCGLSLPSPVGLAAGFDKDAEVFDAALGLGFGFAEVGTLTPKPQRGNPRPRVFRLREDRALINRLGFNNSGIERAVARLSRRVRAHGVVGVNIGKNKESIDAVADYLVAMRAAYPHADYLTLNISSPNTAGLRDLQHQEALVALLSSVDALRGELTPLHGRLPLFLKLAPDLTHEQAFAAADTAMQHGIDALIISNTTLDRPRTLKSAHKEQAGGLSGAPLFASSTALLSAIYLHTRGTLPLIGVGGVASGEEAYAKIRSGASAVQLYTGLVYEGFGLPARINAELAALLARDGFQHVADAVGTKPYSLGGS